MDDHFGILEDAPKATNPNCCFGAFNKDQLKYFVIMWLAAIVVVGLIIGIPYITYRVLPKPVTSSQAGLLSFSEERCVPVILSFWNLVHSLFTRHWASSNH